MYTHIHTILIRGLLIEFLFFIILLYCQLHGGKSTFLRDSES